jgi:hypothetical protein
MKITRRTLVTAAGIGGLVIGVVLVAGAAGAIIGNFTKGDPDDALATPSAPASAAPSPSLSIADQVNMKLMGDCTACHSTPDGGVGTKPIPALAHPLQGWSDCTGCHAPDKLVQTAPGHTGIHKDQCTVCHTKYSPPAPDRPHPAGLQLDCLSCHGTTKAHLPTTMRGWKDTTCWLCHRATTNPAPQVPHTLELQVACRSCHTVGKTGALPPNHATRTDSTCTACHLVDPNAAPVAPHDLASRAGQCAFCHDPNGTAGKLTSPLPSGSSKP